VFIGIIKAVVVTIGGRLETLTKYAVRGLG
jgi:hypothetical protein